MSVAGIGVVHLGVAVIETALIVHVGAGGHHIRALRLPVHGYSRCRVIAVAHPSRDRDAVHLVAPSGNRQRVCWRADIGRTSPAGTLDGQVVMTWRLVVDPHDNAGRIGAEGVLLGSVGVIARSEQTDVLHAPIRTPSDLVQRAVIAGKERSGRAVRCDARRPGVSVNVARPSRRSCLGEGRRSDDDNDGKRCRRDNAERKPWMQ